MRNQGHVVSREMLTREVWKEAGRHTPLDNVIDVHVARLRRKLDEQFDQKLLHTVRGVGFRDARRHGMKPRGRAVGKREVDSKGTETYLARSITVADGQRVGV